MDIGQRLKAERTRLGKSQAELATEIGIAKKSQTNYELGHSAPSADYLAAAAAAGVDVLFVLTGVHSPAIAGEEAELLRRYRASLPEVRAAILGALGITAVPGKPSAVHISGGEQGQVIHGSPEQPNLTINVGTRKKR